MIFRVILEVFRSNRISNNYIIIHGLHVVTLGQTFILLVRGDTISNTPHMCVGNLPAFFFFFFLIFIFIYLFIFFLSFKNQVG